MPQYNFVDLSGQRFGRLVVLERVENKWSPSGQRHTQYLCQCDCGNTTITQAQLLRQGRTVSCGCVRSEMNKGHISLEGKVFGKLTVMQRDNIYITPDGRHKSRWICVCECGNIIKVLQSNLVGNKSASCGCQKESRIATQLKKYLEENYSAISEYKIIQHPTNHRWMPYDIYIPDGIFIEVHGLQHYQYVKYFHENAVGGFENRKYIDDLKKQFAEQNGIYIEIDLRKIKTLDEAIAYVESIIAP